MTAGLALGIMYFTVELGWKENVAVSQLKQFKPGATNSGKREKTGQKRAQRWARRRPPRRTFPRVEGVPPQAKGAATDVAAEALAVEEEALGAQPLHHVHPLAAKMAGVAAAKPGGAVLTRHTLKKGKITKVTGWASSP